MAKVKNVAIEAVMNEEVFAAPVVETPVVAVPVSLESTERYQKYVALATSKLQVVKPATAFANEREIAQENMFLHGMCSGNQIRTIHSIQERMGAKITPADSFYGKSYEEVSDLIGRLIEFEKATAATRKTSEKQAEYIADMFFCPEADFSDLKVVTKIFLDETTIGENGEQKKLWRRPTRSEMIVDIMQNVFAQEARDFISKYSGPFREWKANRPSRKQIDKAIELQGYMADVRVNRTKMEIAEDGSIIEVPADNEWSPIGYVGYSEDELAMLSVDEINDYMTRLRSELKSLKIPYTNTDDAELKKKFDSFEQVAISNEDFAYKLLAIAGHEDELLVHNASKPKYVVTFIKYLVDNEFTSYESLKRIAGFNEYAVSCVNTAMKKK